MFIAVLKKEFRQHAALWIALFLFVIVLQLLAAIMYTLSGLGSVQKPSFVGIAVVISFLYAAGSAAIAFCNEHEEKTYTFLRSLPIPCGKLLAGKLGWVIFSSVIFGAGTVLESLPWEAGFGNISLQYNESLTVLFVCTLGLLCPIAFGLFWSTWFKSQLHALIATFISGTVTVVAIMGTVAEYGNTYSTPESERAATIVVLTSLVTLIVGAVAVYRGYYWTQLEKRAGDAAQRSPRTDLFEDASPGIALRSIPGSLRKRGEFLTLFIHAFRQSSGLFLSGIFVAVFVFFVTSTIFLVGTLSNGPDIVASLILCLGGIMAITYCGSVFSAEQKNHGAFFAERGISPGKVWWSRILAFGVPYFVVGLSLLAIPLYFGIRSAFFNGVPNWEVNEKFSTFIITCIGCYIPVFFIGQLVSMLFRSGIVAIVLTGTFTWLFFIWVALLTAYLGHWPTISVPIAVGGPLLLGCLVASRLRIDDWLRGRSLWKSKRPVLTALLLPPLIILVTIPPYRVYSVPVVDMGYRVDPLVLERHLVWDRSIDEKLCQWMSMYWRCPAVGLDIERDSAFNLDAIKKAMLDPNEAIFDYQCTNYEREALWSRSNNCLPYENNKDPQQPNRIILSKVDTAKIDKGIAFLRQLVENRPSTAERLKRIYEVEYRLAKYGDLPQNYSKKEPIFTALAVLKLMPWERTRILKRLAYEFQMQSYAAENADDLIFRNNGDFREMERMSRATERRLTRDSSSLIDGQFSMLHSWRISGAWYVYETELQRRGRIIQFALVKYRKEKGKLPEKLDELKTAGYLDEIPGIPGTNFSFYYDPSPKNVPDNIGYKYRPGEALLWGPRLDWVKRYDGNPFPPNDAKHSWATFINGHRFDLNFME